MKNCDNLKTIDDFKFLLEMILDQQFPKKECKERGAALVLYAYACMAAEGLVKNMKDKNES
jgi:hypothetical protein